MPGCQSTTPCPSTSRPRRPARPVSWVYSPGVMSACVSPFHLSSFSITTVRAGMLMPSASVSVANTAFTRPRVKSSSTTSLNAGSMPAWWAAMPRVAASRKSWKPSTCRSAVGRCATAPSTYAWISSRSSGVVRRRFGAHALLHGGVAAHPAEHEHDRGQQPVAVEPVDHVDAARDPDAAAVADLAPVSGLAPPALVPRGTPVADAAARPVVPGQLDELVVDRGALLDEAGRSVDVGGGEQVEQALADHDVLVERHRAALLDDRRGVAAHRLQPLAELLGVRHRGRQRDQGHRLREVDDHLLPDGAPRAVGEVVHLVHHHEAEPEQGPRPGVQHVAQHLGRHHHDRRLAVDHVVAGQQADLLGAVAVDEVVELLVRQRLDRRGVEALAAGRQRQVHRELADHRLAGAGGRRDQHAVAVLDAPAGLDLERVEREGVRRREVAQHGMALVGGVRRVPLRRGEVAHERTVSAPGTQSTVTGSAPNRSPSAYATMPGAATVTERTRWCSYCGCVTWVPLNSLG